MAEKCYNGIAKQIHDREANTDMSNPSSNPQGKDTNKSADIVNLELYHTACVQYERHCEQKMKCLNFFLVLISGIIALQITILGNPNMSTATTPILFCVSVMAIIISLVFVRMQNRTELFIKFNRDLLIQMEGLMDSGEAIPTKVMPLFREMTTKEQDARYKLTYFTWDDAIRDKDTNWLNLAYLHPTGSKKKTKRRKSLALGKSIILLHYFLMLIPLALAIISLFC